MAGNKSTQGGWMGRSVSRREAIKLGLAGTSALAVSMYVKPAMQNIGVAKASSGTPPPTNGFEGCTPGFWGNHPSLWPQGYDPYKDTWKTYFNTGQHTGSFEDVLLLDILPPPDYNKTACEHQFAIHAIAALLNAASDSVNYPLTVNEVIEAVNDAVGASGTCQQALLPTKNMFNDLHSDDAECNVKD